MEMEGVTNGLYAPSSMDVNRRIVDGARPVGVLSSSSPLPGRPE